MPTGVRRPRVPAAPKPRTRSTGAASGARRASPAAGASRGPAAAPPPRGPAEALVKLRKVLFHATAYQAWPSIAELGLLPPNQVLADDPRLGATRPGPIHVAHLSGHDISVRDQRPMARANMEAHLDGIGLVEWLAILNERAFLFARQRDLTTFLGRYRETEGQDVLVFDTARLLGSAKGRTEVTTVNSTAPVPWEHCRCRNRDTFEPIDSFAGDVADINEVTIVGGIEHAADLVVRVMRYHPDGTTEVVVG